MRTYLLPLMCLSLVGANANAATFFTGLDVGAGEGDARPNATAAQTAFLAAAGAVGTLQPVITFEGNALGFVNPTIAPGLSVSFVGADVSGIMDDSNVQTGYNTTAGGERYLRFGPQFNGAATATFNFDSPVSAFGGFLTGPQPNFGSLSATFDDGSVQTVDIVGDAAGGVMFWGFTAAGASITSVSFTATANPAVGRDIIGFDDLYIATAAVPEPATWLTMLVGFGALGGALRRRQSVAVRFA